MVKQLMIALYTFDDKGYYIKRYERVPWGFSENEYGDKVLTTNWRINFLIEK